MQKIKKDSLPAGHTKDNFQCCGPIATKDGQFTGTRLCDLGCFNQSAPRKKSSKTIECEAVDSNKYYHAAIVKSCLNDKWYVYTEFGRVGGPASFQFYECDGYDDAEKTYIKKLNDKNIKRGEWIENKTLGRILQAKPGKDLYVVRDLNSRNIGLPSAREIITAKKTILKGTIDLDAETLELLRDLGQGTQTYTRSSTVGNIIPSESAVKEARLILNEASKAVNNGNTTELINLSYLLYGRIPVIKNKGEKWELDADKISKWNDDLDVFESALHYDVYESGNPLEELNLVKLKYVPKNSEKGGFIYDWMPKASANRHSYLPGKLQIKNIWYIERQNAFGEFEKFQRQITQVNNEFVNFQPQKRTDKFNEDLYRSTNTFMLFHGTQSVNVSSILRESLRLPSTLVNVKITGKNFTSGSYFASDFRKSCGYTSLHNSYWTKGQGGISSRGAFMFIADVCLGKIYVAPHTISNRPSVQHDSIWGKAGYSGVENDEFVTFRPNQFMLRYLIEFSV